ncbi:DUF4240 domain-containing protein [Clostridium sp. ZBS18]|uniref:DUF4240 domain-containing protein n=1 Tax=Clostridium sp. ZBS18 TaxID=2949967 RepID=UPI002079A6D7|nr:DUF4240 domain-containing protein [Clostridium sp. ZBS18]
MDRETFWRIINYTESHSMDMEDQLKELQLILNKLDKNSIKQMKNIWIEVRNKYLSVPDLNYLKCRRGGFINNDFKNDVNDYDFINWLIMQGSKLYAEVTEVYGVMAIATYFIKYRIDRKQCYFYNTKVIFNVKPCNLNDRYNCASLNKMILIRAIKLIEVLIGEDNIATKLLTDKLDESI